MPRRAAPLSAKQIEVARKRNDRSAELIDGLVPGLRLRIGAGASLHWSLAIRDAKGAMRRFHVGQNLALSHARELARKLKQEVKAGADPTQDRRIARRRARDARIGIGTFGGLLQHYFEHGDGAALKTKQEQQRRIRGVFKKHLDRSALDITVAELQITAEEHPAHAAAGHAVAYLKPLWRWAAKRGAMQKGYEELTKPANPESNAGHRPALDHDTVRKVWPTLEGPHGVAAKLMLWTACRRAEVTGAKWSEFNLSIGAWAIAPERRKDTRTQRQKANTATPQHIIPLPRQAVDMLRGIQPAAATGAELVFPNADGHELDNWDRWTKQIWRKTDTKDWNRHDLRRTCVTIAADLGVEPHILSVLLGHKSIQGNRLLGIYNKSRYQREHGEALQLVADFLDGLVVGNVVPMRRAR